MSSRKSYMNLTIAWSGRTHTNRRNGVQFNGGNLQAFCHKDHALNYFVFLNRLKIIIAMIIPAAPATPDTTRTVNMFM